MSARRLYFSNSNNPTAPNNPALYPAKGALWDSTSVVRRALNLTPLNSALGAFSAAPVGSGSKLDYDVLNASWSSGGVGGTIPYTGNYGAGVNFSMVIGTQESSLTADFTLQVHVRVVSSDCSVVRGVLLDHVAAGPEYVAATQTRIIVNQPLTDVAVQTGDRIVVEVGARSAYSGTTNFICYLRVGDPTAGADFALTSGLTTDLRPWCEFSVDPFTTPAPGVPTNVAAANIGPTAADLDWDPPAAGGPVTSYQVRLDAGAPSTATSPHSFTGLTTGVGYDLAVRAVGPGGDSAWVTVHVVTYLPPEPGYYRVELAVGPYSWDISSRDDPEYGPRLPLSLGWSMPDTVEFFPCQADQTTMNFQLYVAQPSDVASIVKGSTVTFAMYVDSNPLADPWQTFAGIVTQLDGSSVAGGGFLLTVYATDDTARLGELYVGYAGGDWPDESIYDRLNRIATEAGFALVVFRDQGLVGGLAARDEGAAIDALSAIRAALRDAANNDSSTVGGPYYGRFVLSYDGAGASALVSVIHRRVPGEWQVPPNPVQLELDGCYVDALGSWAKLPGPDGRSWVLVDGTTYGTPSGPPIARSTSLLATLDVDWDSATEKGNLGDSLLPDGSTQLQGWYARQLRYRASAEGADLDVVGPYIGSGPGLASFAPLNVVIPVVVTDVLPEYDLEGVGYLAGTLTGARMTIPVGGAFYVDLRLRPELLSGMELP